MIVSHGRNMIAPTAHQLKMWIFIRDFVESHGYPPTVREIGQRFAIRSPNGVKANLHYMRKKRLIGWDPLLSRSLTLSGYRAVLVPEPIAEDVRARVADYEASHAIGGSQCLREGFEGS